MSTIRRSDDLELVQELDREIFPKSPRLSQKELEDSTWWVAYVGGAAVGFAGIKLLPAKAKAYLTRAGVVKLARGSGLQKRFIRLRVSHAKRQGIPRVYTYVWAGNFASQRSLISCGFRPYYLERYENASYTYFENRRAST